jgi:dienelactone hydrolase
LAKEPEGTRGGYGAFGNKKDIRVTVLRIRKQLVVMQALLSLSHLGVAEGVAPASPLPTPPEIWQDYDPDAGDFKEEVIVEKTENGVYFRDSYISAYVNDEEIRVYCKYAVKAGAKDAPGLMNVHGWMGGPAVDLAYVKDGWAVMAHDYSGITKRPHHTKYPEALGHGHMEARKMGYRLIYSRMPDGNQITDPKATSHYLWNAVQRRALSYLAAQKEVDSGRIGAKGYSYGGTIMWNLAMDSRVKAVVAYFGIGWINYYRDHALWMYNVPYREPDKTPGEELFLSAVAPQAHAPHITAASLWLNGSNDHHGGHERAGQTFDMFKPGVPWDFAVQARGHHNTDRLGNDCKLWLEKHVLGKDNFWPARPTSAIRLGNGGAPELHLTPASPKRIKDLQVYECLKTANNIERYWRDVKSERRGNTWIAKLPVMNVNDYVFSYANIRYDNGCVVSSDFEAVIPAKLGNAVASDTKSDVLPGGADRWSHAAPAEGVGGISGFRPICNRRGTHSDQFSDPKWKAPRDAGLTFKFYCTQPQTLVLTANGRFTAEIEITASDEWQSMTIKAGQLKHPAGFAMGDWSEVKNIGFKPKQGSDITKVVLARFEWNPPERKAPEAGKDGKVYLTKEMASSCESFWRVLNDGGVEGKPISVGGKTYARGLGVHADSELRFPLNGRFAAFHVVPGPDDAHRGLLEMKILVDGKAMFASGKVRSADFEAKRVTIPLVGARELTLVVTDAGDGKGGDHACWADAYLSEAE